MISDSLISRLISDSQSDFTAALPELRAIARLPLTVQEQFARDFIQNSLDASLGPTIKRHRINVAVSSLALDHDSLVRIANEFSGLPSGARQLVSAALPENVRHILYTGNRSATAPSTSIASTVSHSTALPHDLPVQNDSNSGTVLFLANAENQTANLKLIASLELGNFRLTSTEDLDAVLHESNDLCACIVDGTYLDSLTSDEQLMLFNKLAVYSTFWWIRVQDHNLKISHLDLNALIREERGRRTDVTLKELSIQQSGTLRESELPCISEANKVLASIDRGRFLPDELIPSEATALMAAAEQYAKSHHGSIQPEVTSLRTRSLHGGMTLQKVVSIRVNERGATIIVKIGDKTSILSEAKRFLQFIQAWDHELLPITYLHGKSGLIFFGVINDPDQPLVPAPTLESRIKSLWISEQFPVDLSHTIDPDDLIASIRRATTKIAQLNSQCANSNNFPCYSNPNVDNFRYMAKANVNWGFDQVHLQARDKSEKRFENLRDQAILHGDVHLRNILVRAERDSFLVDYANSGPGHPAVDLVRLEMSLFLRGIKQVADEQTFSALQKSLSIDLLSIDEISELYSAVISSKTNRVCIEGCVIARDAVLSVLKSHKGDTLDYLIVKYLVAWQSLAMDDIQSGLARSVIVAIASHIDSLC